MELLIPHRWTPEKHQLPVLQNKARYKVLVWHRKAHKTTLAINELIRQAVLHTGTYWYVTPFYNQGKKIVWQDPEMFPKYCPPEIWKDRNDSECYVKFPNGSIIYLLGADRPETLRGPNPRGVVLDECKDMKIAKIWQAVLLPIFTANPNAWCWFIGTVESPDEFWTKYLYARDSGDPEWYASILRASESGIMTKEALENARKTTTQAYFDAEYECKPTQNASAYFRRIRENTYDHTKQNLPTNGDFQVGVDLAKYNDYTVITPFNRNKFVVYPQDRFNQVDWNLQKARIQVAVGKLQNAKVCIDRTGAGEPIVEDLKRVGVNIPTEPFDHAFVFTQQSRDNLLRHLAILLEQDKIKIPNDEGLIAELESFRYELSDRGTIKVSVPEGLHDDRVMSLALAVYGNTERVEYSDPRAVMLREWEESQNNVKNFAR